MELILTSVVAFASTNVDDLFILMLFFANKEFKPRQVILGQYLGILALIIISVIGSFIGLLIEQIYIGLLGLLPVYIGIRNIIYHFTKEASKAGRDVAINTKTYSKVLSVAAVTFANGGDNIAIYIPLFTTLWMSQKLIMIAIFLIMVAIWCIAARYLGKHPVVSSTIDRYGHIITPIILILLGIYIFYESGSSILFNR